MLTERDKLTRLLQIQVMGYGEGLRVRFNQVKGVLVAFPSFAAAGCGGSALNDDDPAVTVMSGKEVQRAPDIGPVQVSAQDHLDLLLDKAVDGASCPGHRDIEDAVVSGCKMMVGNNDACHVLRHCGKGLFAMAELMGKNPAVRDAVPWRGGIETNQHDVADTQYRIEIGRDDFAVQSVWFEEALEDPPQRHVVVAGNHEHRDSPHAIEELPGLLELVTLSPLCQIATHHQGIRGE